MIKNLFLDKIWLLRCKRISSSEFFYFLMISVFLILGCKKENVNTLTKSEFISINIDWNPIQFPLEMKIFELKSELPHKLWETSNVSNLQESPLSNEIPNSKLTVQVGRFKEFALAVYNNSNESIYFFASPHQVTPPELSLGFKFKCLCVNHAFEVKPKQFWYRIVKINISKDFLGSEFKIKHDLIGISKERMQEFSNKKESTIEKENHDL